MKLCPICLNDMILKKGRKGSFYSCSRYPNCKGTLPYYQKDEQHIPSLDKLFEYTKVDSGFNAIEGQRYHFIGVFIGKAKKHNYCKEEVQEYLISKIPDYKYQIEASIRSFYS